MYRVQRLNRLVQTVSGVASLAGSTGLRTAAGAGGRCYYHRPAVMGSRLQATKSRFVPLVSSRSMYIQTSATPNDDALKFLPSQEVLGDGARTIEYLSGRDAHSSPLARKLFAVDGVRSVMFGPDFITVEKDPESNWIYLKPEIFSLLTEHLSAGGPVVLEGTEAASDTLPSEEDSEVVSMIKELIDTRIRPAIQEDGGDLEYRGFTDDGIVQLKLRGACRSCDSSSVTLKNGIESMLMHYVEEVTGVEQVLDPEEEVSLKEFDKLEKKLEAAKQSAPEDQMAPSL
ncbi:Nfu1p [Sugiyamaella lignohabitans]|uniref:Nfu1p n=1 Tax=Sugiyamaella lignohabitans TaxID=796027 RepID=A0A167C680_9ASCO|nr:Nfu1p [Sugiyamaella lignohabitans]ANB11270.1 Nfu1p [Sugiyamaella lignohabitans]